MGSPGPLDELGGRGGPGSGAGGRGSRRRCSGPTGSRGTGEGRRAAWGTGRGRDRARRTPAGARAGTAAGAPARARPAAAGRGPAASRAGSRAAPGPGVAEDHAVHGGEQRVRGIPREVRREVDRRELVREAAEHHHPAAVAGLPQQPGERDERHPLPGVAQGAIPISAGGRAARSRAARASTGSAGFRSGSVPTRSARIAFRPRRCPEPEVAEPDLGPEATGERPRAGGELGGGLVEVSGGVAERAPGRQVAVQGAERARVEVERDRLDPALPQPPEREGELDRDRAVVPRAAARRARPRGRSRQREAEQGPRCVGDAVRSERAERVEQRGVPRARLGPRSRGEEGVERLVVGGSGAAGRDVPDLVELPPERVRVGAEGGGRGKPRIAWVSRSWAGRCRCPPSPPSSRASARTSASRPRRAPSSTGRRPPAPRRRRWPSRDGSDC